MLAYVRWGMDGCERLLSTRRLLSAIPASRDLQKASKRGRCFKSHSKLLLFIRMFAIWTLPAKGKKYQITVLSRVWHYLSTICFLLQENLFPQFLEKQAFFFLRHETLQLCLYLENTPKHKIFRRDDGAWLNTKLCLPSSSECPDKSPKTTEFPLLVVESVKSKTVKNSVVAESKEVQNFVESCLKARGKWQVDETKEEVMVQKFKCTLYCEFLSCLAHC